MLSNNPLRVAFAVPAPSGKAFFSAYVPVHYGLACFPFGCPPFKLSNGCGCAAGIGINRLKIYTKR
jgi:hypothetical protein